MNIDKLCELYSGFDKKTMKGIKKSKTPLITVTMLSFMRLHVLKATLKEFLNYGIPLNFCLRVQGAELLSRTERIEILDLVSKFYAFDIQFTHKNHGTGYPRNDLMQRAFKHFDAPYVMATDDDMFFPPNALIALASLLRNRNKFGAIGMDVKPQYNAWFIRKKNIEGYGFKWGTRKPTPPFDSNIDAMGSAPAMFKREVLKTCISDPNYHVGLWDIDFYYQLKRAGWRLGILKIPGFCATNKKGGDLAYTRVRYNKREIQKSIEYFRKKWNVYVR